MIKIEKVLTEGWSAAIRGMRNPKDSWALGDSGYLCACYDGFDCDTGCGGMNYCCMRKADSDHACFVPDMEHFKLGPNDLKLASQLAGADADSHAKFLRMITVSMDVTAPLYWWKEYDTYKVGTVANSCSTMHRIHVRPLTMDDFSHEHLLNYMCSEADNYRSVKPADALTNTINMINESRDRLALLKDDPARYKMFWWQMIQLLPSSYNQKRTLTANYQVMKNIYHDRKNHKLDEWREFCKMIETLPYAKELIC